jgi:putative DNA primase/helicase
MSIGLKIGAAQRPHDDLPELRQALAGAALEVVEALLGGPPCERRGSSARWDGRAFSLVIAGTKRGLWRDHKSGTGGDLLALIQRETGRDFLGAVAWARDFLGGAWRDDPERRRRRETEDRKAKAEDDRRRLELDRLLRGLRPITGTPAETYLAGRGLTATAWPAAVRWSPEARALVFVVTDAGGEPVAIQRVMLGADGRPLLDDAGKKRKLSLGPVTAGAVRLPGDPAGPLVLAEGGETALAIWLATGFETWALLGVVRPRIDLETVPRDRLLVIAADDDAEFPLAPSQKAITDTLRAVRQDGRRAVPIWPRATRRHDKGDFADLLLEAGPEAVRRRFAEALDTQGRTHVRNGLPVAEARRKLAELTSSTVAGLLAAPWDRDDETAPPPAALIAASLGLGKTETALAEALLLIGAGRGPVVISTPTHKLNAELVQRARDLAARMGNVAGLTRIEMHLGREAIDPAGDGEARMCFDLEAVREVQEAGLDAQGHVCERREGRTVVARCPHFGSCAYQAQRQRQADLILVSHAALGHTRPSEIGDPTLLVIDERPTDALLRGVDGRWIVLGDADLAPVPGNRSGLRAAAWEADRRELVEARRKLADLAARAPLGGLRRADLEAVGIDAEMARKAAGQTLALVAGDDELMPGMDPARRREILQRLAGNRQRLREGTLWREVAAFLERPDQAPEAGRILRVEARADDGAAFLAWRIVRLAPIAKGWRAPTLLLDATARPEDRPVLRATFPGLRDDLGGEVIAATPHLRVTVITGRKVSKAALGASPKLHRELAAWTAAKLRELDARTHVGAEPGRALLIGNAALEAKLEADGLRLPRVDHGHFNALRGRDAWRDCRLAVIAGRTAPPPQAVELIAGAISGRACEVRVEAGAWYARETAPLVIGGEVVGETPRDRHPDPLAEAIRWQACEAELLQAAGRLRAVGRNADRPADLALIGCPLPDGLEVDAVEAWQAPGPVETMLALGGVAPLSAPAAAACFPEIFPSADAAEAALARAGGSRHSLMEALSKEMSGTSPPRGATAYRYRQAGPGRRPVLALVDPAACPDPRAWLAARLGPLALFELLHPSAPVEAATAACGTAAGPVVVEVPVAWIVAASPVPAIGRARVEAVASSLVPSPADRIELPQDVADRLRLGIEHHAAILPATVRAHRAAILPAAPHLLTIRCGRARKGAEGRGPFTCRPCSPGAGQVPVGTLSGLQRRGPERRPTTP